MGSLIELVKVVTVPMREIDYLSVAALCLFATVCQAAEPWDLRFVPDTAGILQRAAALSAPDDAEVQVLLEEHRISIDSKGHARFGLRKVYRILKEDAIEEWASVEQGYQPWREQKPTIRARVVTKDGGIHMLDPKTIADAPQAQFDNSVFSDARVAQAPLPAVAVGAVVEVEIVSEGGPAFREAGIARRFEVSDAVPLERFSLHIDAANGVSLRTASRGIADALIRKTTNRSGTRVEIELGPFQPRKEYEGNLPPEESLYPSFSFSTAASWQALASRYAEIVDHQIESANVESLTGGGGGGASPLAIAARLSTALHRSVRYTGVEFGEAAIVPARPADVLQRKFGDCKDKSVLLVAMLRAAGLKASVALLHAGHGPDVDSELPGIDLFNHAIVYVDGPEPLWIDATANHARIGTLPSGDQGRFALIAANSTTRLVKTPEQAGVHTRHTYEIRFKDFGPGSITETMESNGAGEAYLRGAYSASDNAKTALERYVKSAFAAKRLGNYEVSGKDDLSLPVRVKVEAVETMQAVTTTEAAQVLLSAEALMNEVPYEVRRARDPGEPPAKRRHDYLFPQSGTVEYIHRLYPPPLYKSGSLPASTTIQLGPLQLSRAYRKETNGTVEAVFTLVIPKRRISAAEYEAMRVDYQRHASQFTNRMTFVPQTAELLATGQTSKAIALLREIAAKSSGSAGIHIHISRTLLSAGLGIPARQEAELATRLEPGSPQAWQAVAWAYQNDSFGRLRRGDWNRATALKALRKAIELDPEDQVAKADLAILLEFNDAGERYGKGSDAAEAIRIYREMLEKQPNQMLFSNLAFAWLYQGNLEEAAAAASKGEEGQKALIEAIIQSLREGAGPAIVALQAATPNPQTRAQLLQTVAMSMIHLRRYPEAVLFIQAAERVTNSPQIGAMIRVLSKFKRYEDVKHPDTDPRSVMQRLIRLLLTREPVPGEIDELVIRTGKGDRENEALASLRKESLGDLLPLIQLGFDAENFIDMTVGGLQLAVEGDDRGGYRVFSTAGSESALPTLFVVKTDTGYKAIGSADSMEEIGRRVLDLVKEKKIAEAQAWLDLAVPHLKSGPDGWKPAAHGLWSGVNAANRGPQDVRTAAASLIGHGDGSADAVEILKAAYPLAKNAIDRGQLDLALCEAHAKAKRWTDLAGSARRLMTSRTYDTAGYQYLMRTYQERMDWKGLEVAALALTKGAVAPNDAWQYVAIGRMLSGNFVGATEAIGNYQKTAPGAASKELNAWNQLLVKKVADSTIALVHKGNSAEESENPYLLALLLLAQRKTEEGQDVLRRAVGNREADSLDARAWVAYGNICDQYGFPEAAATAWSRGKSARSGTRESQWAIASLEP
jgi:tetratricopeptide (TPR) repeat protein